MRPTTTSAVVASVGDLKRFANAWQFGVWLGLVLSQNSTGGQASLGRIKMARRRQLSAWLGLVPGQ